MRGTFSNVQDAVDKINEYRNWSREKGFDCKRERWVVVCVESTKITNQGLFIREEICRYNVAKVHYSEQMDAYVCEEVQLQSAD